MKVGEVCNRVPEVIGADESVQAAAERMRQYHVGNLVVVDEASGKRVPIGIITVDDIMELLTGLQASWPAW